MAPFVDDVRSEILGQMADCAPAGDILAGLARSFEANVPGTKAGVTILDPSLGIFENAVFPSLSPSYAEALQGIKVEERPGSCALAVYEGRTVVSTDVATDSRFADAWKSLGADHGLEALVSIPAKGGDGKSLGTFVVAYPPKSGLNREDLSMADAFAEICGLVLTYRREGLNSAAVN